MGPNRHAYETLNRLARHWAATLELPEGRTYRFYYLIDGSEWLNERHTDDRKENGRGLADSIVALGP
jgi:hypothetical protein